MIQNGEAWKFPLTQTMVSHSIINANLSIRNLLKTHGIVNFEDIESGPENKEILDVLICTSSGIFESEATFYKPRTKRGTEARMWPRLLGRVAEEGDWILMAVLSEQLCFIVMDSEEGAGLAEVLERIERLQSATTPEEESELVLEGADTH